MNSRKKPFEGSFYDQVLLVTAGYDHQIKFWQAHTAVCCKTIQHQESQVNDLEISPDRSWLAVAVHQQISIYDIKTSNLVLKLDGISRNVSQVCFFKDGKTLVSSGEDGSVKIWDLRSKKIHSENQFQINTAINSFSLHPDQSKIFACDQEGLVHIWVPSAKKVTKVSKVQGSSLSCCCLNSDGTSLASINSKGECHMWQVMKAGSEDLTLRSSFQAHSKYGLRCLFSPDATILVTTSADGTAKLWRTAGNTKRLELDHKTNKWVWDCAFSNDSEFIITASSDCMAYLWNASLGSKIREFNGHTKPITCLAFKDRTVE